MDYPGKVIRKTPVTPTQTSASGVWTLDDAIAATKTNTWPVAGVPNPISKSLRFNSADSAYLNRTPASAGNRKTWTWSGWVKRSALSTGYILDAGTGPNTGLFIGGASDTLSFFDYTSGPSYNLELITTQSFRDVSAWYHIVVAVDTTQATSSNRVKIYLNGSQITNFLGATYPSQNFDTGWNNATAHRIGGLVGGGSYLNGYLTEINFIDGQALTPSSFGMTDPQTGAWIPIKYTGTYGTNGFYLNFKDATSTTTLGYDYSGNGNNYTPNNFSVTAGSENDSLTDVPTPWIAYSTTGDVGGVVRGNYSTLNPLWSNTITLSNGNLQGFGGSGGTGDVFSTSTIGMSSGKWYCEVLYAAKGGASALNVGIIERNTNQNYPDYGYYSNNGNKYNDLSSSAYGASWDVNDVIGISYDADVGTLVFYKNGVSQGTAFSGLSGTYFFCQARFGSDSHTTQWNFGQRPFAYTPPAGFLSLCTTNLPTPTIGATSTTTANKYFDILLWSGTGGARTLSGLGFQPDWVWGKGRSGSATYPHLIWDVLRGTNLNLVTNTNDAEFNAATSSSNGGLGTSTSDGFTIVAGTSSADNLNASSPASTYVGWAWKANGAGSSNTDGTVTSTVSVNTTAGFSVITFTAPTSGNFSAGHGLGVTPGMVITKVRGRSGTDWLTWHNRLNNGSPGTSYYLALNTTAAQASFASVWGSTGVTSSVVGMGVGASCGASDTIVAYCFAPVAGYSAFGSYTGNASTDGPFVYTGFRPRFIFGKDSGGTNNWWIFDSARDTYNVAGKILRPNLSDAELDSPPRVDLLSNGFKIRTTGLPNDATTNIYAAFAEFPFKFSNAR